MKHNVIRSSIAAALGLGALAASPLASASPLAGAGTVTASWTGYVIPLLQDGGGFANTSLSAKTSNQFVTPISGTLQYDAAAGTGSATIQPFEFCSNQPGLPAEFVDISLQGIGDGQGGAGSLLLANMLFNWNGNYGVPVSVVFDAAGLLGSDFTSVGNVISGTGATPASDGTYIGMIPSSGGFLDANGYLAMGPMPMATTAWNTSFAPGCTTGVDGNFSNNNGGGCMGVNPSGILPLVLDDTQNQVDYLANTGAQAGTWGPWGEVYGVGGNPMADGPFVGLNFNFNIAAITVTDYNEVPVPAAVWLLGSGLLGLLGATRRRDRPARG